MADPKEEYKAALAGYRAHLIEAGQKAQEDYDKTVFALSGGAFGISFAFVKHFLPAPPAEPEATGFIIWAWGAWGASISAVLLSFFFSILALRKAVRQTDGATPENPLANPGKHFSFITAALNLTGGVLFLVGAVLLILFVRANI